MAPAAPTLPCPALGPCPCPGPGATLLLVPGTRCPLIAPVHSPMLLLRRWMGGTRFIVGALQQVRPHPL